MCPRVFVVPVSAGTGLSCSTSPNRCRSRFIGPGVNLNGYLPESIVRKKMKFFCLGSLLFYQ